MKPMFRKGFMMVLSSPSGAGKTTLSRLLLDADNNLVMSVSATTRAKRPGEVEGVDYFFTGAASFQRMIGEEAFLEYAEVFGNYYGTPRKKVDESLEAGVDVLFDIDWQGTEQLAARRRDDLVSVFILPPSMAELEQRLRRRAQDSGAIITKRMEKASGEISHWDAYDYVIVNLDIQDSLKRVLAILHAERQKRTRQQGLEQFVAELLGSRQG